MKKQHTCMILILQVLQDQIVLNVMEQQQMTVQVITQLECLRQALTEKNYLINLVMVSMLFVNQKLLMEKLLFIIHNLVTSDKLIQLYLNAQIMLFLYLTVVLPISLARIIYSILTVLTVNLKLMLTSRHPAKEIWAGSEDVAPFYVLV